MSRLEKIERRLLAHPPDALYSDVRKVLEAHGWLLDRDPAGSHFTFAKEGERIILTVPVHKGRVPGWFVRVVCKRLGLEAE